MSHLLKISSKKIIKRLISSLICLLMISATLPIHILNGAVCFAKGENIDIVLNSLSLANDWESNELLWGKIATADNINIILPDDFTLYGGEYSKNGCKKTCFFDFTDSMFAGKTININGCGKKIALQNKHLFFMDIKDCVVNLNDVLIDGANLERTDSYIKMEEPSPGQKSVLNMNSGSSIKGCFANAGGAIYAGKNSVLNMNAQSSIVGCFANVGGAMFADENATVNMQKNSSISKCFSTNGAGGAIYARYATINMNDFSAIIGCEAASGAGAIYAFHSKVNMNDRSMICGCKNKAGSGGAMCFNCGEVTMGDNSCIGGCNAECGDGGAIYAAYSTIAMNANSGIFKCSAENGYGGAICLQNATANLNETSRINSCSAKDGGAIYAYNGTVNMNGSSSVDGCLSAFGGRINVFTTTSNFLPSDSNINQKPGFKHSKIRTGMPRVPENLDKYEIDDSDGDILGNVENIPYSKPRNIFNKFTTTSNFLPSDSNINQKPGFKHSKIRLGMPRVPENLDKYEIDDSDGDISGNVENIPYSKPRNVFNKFTTTSNFLPSGSNINQKPGFKPNKIKTGMPRVPENLDKYEIDDSDGDISGNVENIPYSKPRNVFNKFTTTSNFLPSDSNINQKPGFKPNKIRVGMPRVPENLDKYEIDGSDDDILGNVENIQYNNPRNIVNIPNLRFDPFAISLPEPQSDRTNNTYSIYSLNYPTMDVRAEAEPNDEKAQDSHKYKLVFETAGDASILPEQVLYGDKGDEIYVPQYIGYHLVSLKCGGLKINVEDGKIVLNRNIIKRADQNNVITLTAHWDISDYSVKYISDGKIVKTDKQNITKDIKDIYEPNFLPQKPGHIFSHWTYGDDNLKLVCGKTQWFNLIESSKKDGVIILIAQFKKMA